MQDPAINERRLRPIYEHLDIGNNKKALQEADKLLKKYPGIQCARALKSLVLLRLGREDEADALIEKLVAEQPTDENTLQVLTYCYKELDQLDKICTLYGNAARLLPGNEELLSHLFMAHVRCGNYGDQQTVALQLYKHNAKNPYYFWAVISIVLKSQFGPDSRDPAKVRLLLALAQRMIDKHIADNRLEAEQEVQLYLNVLQLQHKHDTALAFLQSDTGRRLYPGAPVALRIDAMKRLGRWAELEELVRELLKDNRERWDYYTEFVRCAIERNKAADGTLTDATIEQLRPYKEFIDELIAVDAGNNRGSQLGRLHLFDCLRQAHFGGLTELFGDSMLTLLVQYFERFGHKPCCTNDIQLFLGGLPAADRKALAERLLAACKVSASELPRSRDQMQQHICTLQVSRLCGAHAIGVDHLHAVYSTFSLHYEYGMTTFGANLLPTDMGPSDGYALLAAHVMYDMAHKLRSSGPLVEALCLLHYVISNSQSDFHAKLLCLQIYHRLGFGSAAHKTYETLDVKHVQLDSMGYLHCAQLAIAGIPTEAKRLYDATLKFFTSSYKESLEYLSMCYRFGSFSKLQEFMEFRTRLSNSLHYSLVSAEALLSEMVCMGAVSGEQLINIVGAFNLEPRSDRIDFGDMTDNRDLSVVVRWDAPGADGRPVAETRRADEAESFRQDVQLLRLRSFMLRMVGSCVDVYDSTEALSDALETVRLLRGRWTELVAETRAMELRPLSSERLANLLPSRIHGILRLPYDRFFGGLLRFVLALEDDGVEAGELTESTEALDGVLGEVGAGLRLAFDEHRKSDDAIWTRREFQETLVNGLEIVALACLVLSISGEKYRILCARRAGRKAKPQRNDAELTSAPSDRDRWTAVQTLIATLQTQLNAIETILENWPEPLCPEDLAERIAAMSLNVMIEPVVHSTIRTSHKTVVQELLTIVKQKQRMLRPRAATE